MIDKRCPHCGTVAPCRVTRTGVGYCEWECSGCGRRWTIRDGEAGSAYAFFPDDIDRAFADDSLEPLSP